VSCTRTAHAHSDSSTNSRIGCVLVVVLECRYPRSSMTALGRLHARSRSRCVVHSHRARAHGLVHELAHRSRTRRRTRVPLPSVLDDRRPSSSGTTLEYEIEYVDEYATASAWTSPGGSARCECPTRLLRERALTTDGLRTTCSRALPRTAPEHGRWPTSPRRTAPSRESRRPARAPRDPSPPPGGPGHPA